MSNVHVSAAALGGFDRTPRSTQSTRASQAALQPVDHDECIASARRAACPGRRPRIARNAGGVRYARPASGGWNGFSARTPEHSCPELRSSNRAQYSPFRLRCGRSSRPRTRSPCADGCRSRQGRHQPPARVRASGRSRQRSPSPFPCRRPGDLAGDGHEELLQYLNARQPSRDSQSCSSSVRA